MLITEPKGWMELWERAQSETNTENLRAILSQMNALLAEYEASIDFEPQPAQVPALCLDTSARQEAMENDCDG
ncbi:MAG: hypothetical protein QOD84_2774 [Acidobacteriaceae bacterium]|jgi:hypothetical protein